jgi:hypothetical protein
MIFLAALPVAAAGLYLVGLGVVAIVSPDRARRFLARFASSARAHFTELMLRLIVGAALVLSAPLMRFSAIFIVFGWILIGTTIALFAVPWRLHYRFASWSVPMATRYMPLLAVGSLAAGVFLLVSLLLRPGA